jgi:hypothetical protein
MFHDHLDYFQKPPLGGRPHTKPGDHSSPNAHNHWFVLFYHVWGSAWIKIHWNSMWLRARSHMTSHYTWGWFWRCVGMAFGHFLLGSHNFMVTALGSCVKWTLDVHSPINVWGEPVFSVMAASWFCEKSGWIGKVEDVKPVLWKKNGFQPATTLRRRIFCPDECEIGGFHPVWFI